MVFVFDSGAGGDHVARTLRTAGIACREITFPDLFPFGDKPRLELHRLFLKVRENNYGTIFCACNTMSLVLAAYDYDFMWNNVIPTFPDLTEDAPVCYGTANTVALASLLSESFRGKAVPHLVETAENLYRKRINLDQARLLFNQSVTERIQLGSTHLSYLAHKLGVADQHVEPDYVALYRAHEKVRTV